MDPHDILKVSRGADEAEIDRAFRRLSIVYHPDKRNPATVPAGSETPAQRQAREKRNHDRYAEITNARDTLIEHLRRGNDDEGRRPSYPAYPEEPSSRRSGHRSSHGRDSHSSKHRSHRSSHHRDSRKHHSHKSSRNSSSYNDYSQYGESSFGKESRSSYDYSPYGEESSFGRESRSSYDYSPYGEESSFSRESRSSYEYSSYGGESSFREESRSSFEDPTDMSIYIRGLDVELESEDVMEERIVRLLGLLARKVPSGDRESSDVVASFERLRAKNRQVGQKIREAKDRLRAGGNRTRTLEESRELHDFGISTSLSVQTHFYDMEHFLAELNLILTTSSMSRSTLLNKLREAFTRSTI
ncbi:hypothetical protein GGS24DRAFT_503552 [Hypoxylon argillaceum]|nr:hypothetical protein GGS24DRAFT_503552 [Hypoxylon argillaceum]